MLRSRLDLIYDIHKLLELMDLDALVAVFDATLHDILDGCLRQIGAKTVTFSGGTKKK